VSLCLGHLLVCGYVPYMLSCHCEYVLALHCVFLLFLSVKMLRYLTYFTQFFFVKQLSYQKLWNFYFLFVMCCWFNVTDSLYSVNSLL